MRRPYFKHIVYADDSTENVSLLLRLRLPSLIIGLIIGGLITILISRFQRVLNQQLSLAFFIPVVVYMADAVGTQTETIFVRNLSIKKQAKLSVYVIKELFLGAIIGLIAGALVSIFAYLWLNSVGLALTVGLAMLASITIAAVLAIFIPTIIHKIANIDPAVGAGPFTTVLQDLITVIIYFVIASLIILG